MEDSVKKENNPVTTIDNDAADLINKIAQAKNKDELENLYQQFNINNTKKNAIRVAQLNNLLDKVNNEAEERLTKRAEQISNKEILDYMNAIGNQIERSQKLVDGIKEITAVQVNNTQNNVNINVGESTNLKLNKESRDKITDIISMILKENVNESKPVEIIEEPKVVNETKIDETIDDDEFEGDN